MQSNNHMLQQQQHDKPRFIKKKQQQMIPQDSVEEFKNLEHATNVFGKGNSPSKRVVDENLEEEERLINQMMEELKKQKLQQLQKEAQSKSPLRNDFQLNSQNSLGSQIIPNSQQQQHQQEVYHSFNHSPHSKSPGGADGGQDGDNLGTPYLMKDSITASPSYHRKRDTSPAANYDSIKKKRLEELKQELMNEPQYQQYHNTQFSQEQLRYSDEQTINHGSYPITSVTTNRAIESRSVIQTETLNDSFPLNQKKQKEKEQNFRYQKKGQQLSKLAQNKQMIAYNHSKSQMKTHNEFRPFPKYSPLEDRGLSTKLQSSHDKKTHHLDSSKHFHSTIDDRSIKHSIAKQPPRDTSQTRSRSPLISTTPKSLAQRKNSHKPLDTTRSLTPRQMPQQQVANNQHHSVAVLQPNTTVAAATSSNILSEKTQQIYFKKLQKEVEQAIRVADKLEKGGLNLDDFKNCFYGLEYLPFMQVEENHQQFKTIDQNQTTTRQLIIQEKEFIYNLWSILNPLNNNFLDNALVYDILLLLIYNVQAPLTTTTSFLEEYLDNLYREENIDLDSFVHYQSGEGTLGGGLSQDFMLQLSNLNKYLSYNNLWSLDKLASEFRQIHANKVSYVYSHRPRSQSPINAGFGGSQILNPDDGRRYRKGVIQEHLAQLTFSPSLSSKTKELDQQLTQRLLTEGVTTKSPRDLSANGRQALDLLKEYDQNALNNLKRYELLFYRQQIAEEKIERAKENLQLKELEGCTFKPQTANNTANRQYYNLQKQANQIFKELSTKIRCQKKKLNQDEQERREDKELQECTFKPSLINQKKPKAKDTLPKGYYEQINRLRKVASDKQAQVEQQQKRERGDGYDKIKQMKNVKPPSFMEQQRQKRKLLMYVDVNITPTRTGRIGIYEGDDVRDLAKNFQRTFQLNSTMLHMLTLQLEQHLKAYKDKHGLVQDGGSTFPIASNSQKILIQDHTQVAHQEQPIDEEQSEDDQLHYANTDFKNPYSPQHQDYDDLDDQADIVEDDLESEAMSNNTQRLNDFVQRELYRFEQQERAKETERYMREIGGVSGFGGSYRQQ